MRNAHDRPSATGSARGARLGFATALLVTVAAGVPALAQHRTTTSLRVAIAGDENNLTPYGITFRSGKTIDLIPLVYDSLLHSPFQAEPEPWLAELVESSENGRVWTITLRDDVTWHDGEPLTADDVAFTYRYMVEHDSPLYSHHIDELPLIEDVEVLDGGRVRFTCADPCPTFDVNPGAHVPILPQHIWERVTEPNTFTDLPVGSGPYRLVRYEQDQLYVLEANEDYFKGRPTVDEIRMPVIPESSAMFLALRGGQVDTVSRVVPPESIAELEGAGLEVVRMADYGSVAIDFNNQRGPLAKTEVRRALTRAVDTERITTVLLQDRAKPGMPHYLDPDSPFAHPDLGPVHDPDEATALLDSIDVVDRDGDGVRETADGAPLDFEVLVASVAAREIRAAELVRDQLAEIGVRLRITTLDPATLRERTQPNFAEGRTGDWDMQVREFAGGHFHFDPDGLPYLFVCPGSDFGLSLNFSGYCNPEFDAHAKEAVLRGFEERKAPLHRAQEILYDDPPAISLYFPDGTFAYQTEAYDGWVPEFGHGIFHKRSFLAAYQTAGSPQGAEDPTAAGGSQDAWEQNRSTGNAARWALLGGVLLAGIGVTAVLRRRRSRGPEGPELD